MVETGQGIVDEREGLEAASCYLCSDVLVMQ